MQKPSSADRTVLAKKAAVSIGTVNKPGLKMPLDSVTDLATRKAELLKKNSEIRNKLLILVLSVIHFHCAIRLSLGTTSYFERGDRIRIHLKATVHI